MDEQLVREQLYTETLSVLQKEKKNYLSINCKYIQGTDIGQLWARFSKDKNYYIENEVR